MSLSKFINALILFAISSCASAGLILHDLEWLDLDVTKGMSVHSVNNTVLNQVEYSGYRYATKAEVDAFWDGFYTDAFDSLASSGWHESQGLVNESYTKFLLNGWALNYPASNKTLYTTTGRIEYDQNFISGFMFDDGIRNGRSFKLYSDYIALDGELVAIHHNDYTNHVASAPNSKPFSPYDSYSDGRTSHLIVRAVSVPEPSTLAIFALGMIGLASRRFKKH